jgi:thioredoxin domain-containing protein 5
MIGGHCKSLAPIWEELGEKLKSKVNVGSVDCTIHQVICKKYEVRGYPTLLYINGPDVVIPFSGSRTLEPLAEFALSQIK